MKRHLLAALFYLEAEFTRIDRPVMNLVVRLSTVWERLTYTPNTTLGFILLGLYAGIGLYVHVILTPSYPYLLPLLSNSWIFTAILSHKRNLHDNGLTAGAKAYLELTNHRILRALRSVCAFLAVISCCVYALSAALQIKISGSFSLKSALFDVLSILGFGCIVVVLYLIAVLPNPPERQPKSELLPQPA